MFFRSFAALCLGSALAVAAPAGAVTIDFEDVPAGTLFPTPYQRDGVTISAQESLLVTDIGTGNAICGAVNGSCAGGIAFDFARGARLLSFTLSGDTNPTTQFIFEAAATILFEGEPVEILLQGIIFADGDPLNEQLQAFTSPLMTITSLGVFSLDSSAFVLDNISFTPGDIAAVVPEPASWAMMIGGFGAAGAAMRRRKALALRHA